MRSCEDRGELKDLETCASPSRCGQAEILNSSAREMAAEVQIMCFSHGSANGMRSNSIKTHRPASMVEGKSSKANEQSGLDKNVIYAI